jgi:hypothetical protein
VRSHRARLMRALPSAATVAAAVRSIRTGPRRAHCPAQLPKQQQQQRQCAAYCAVCRDYASTVWRSCRSSSSSKVSAQLLMRALPSAAAEAASVRSIQTGRRAHCPTKLPKEQLQRRCAAHSTGHMRAPPSAAAAATAAVAAVAAATISGCSCGSSASSLWSHYGRARAYFDHILNAHALTTSPSHGKGRSFLSWDNDDF